VVWINQRIAEQRELRASAMAHHPAGKALLPLDQQYGIEFSLPTIPAFEESAGEIYAELLDVLVTKQNDYGPRAVNQAPGGPTLGVLVRAHDKLERLVNLTTTDGIVNHESIRDSWLDLANYAVIGLMVHDGTWPQ
jgi:hypothetical protein